MLTSNQLKTCHTTLSKDLSISRVAKYPSRTPKKKSKMFRILIEPFEKIPTYRKGTIIARYDICILWKNVKYTRRSTTVW